MTNIVTLDIDEELAESILTAIEYIDDRGHFVPKNLKALAEKLGGNFQSLEPIANLIGRLPDEEARDPRGYAYGEFYSIEYHQPKRLEQVTLLLDSQDKVDGFRNYEDKWMIGSLFDPVNIKALSEDLTVKAFALGVTKNVTNNNKLGVV